MAHLIYIRCSLMIAAVNAHIQVVIFQFVFKHWCKEYSGISPPSLLTHFSQRYLVVVATSRDKSEK